MFATRTYDLKTTEIIQVDGIPVPAELYAATKISATVARKTHFLAPVEIKNPNFKEEPVSLLSIAQFGNVQAEMSKRYILTGEFVVSDDRAAVLLHGVGRLLWVTPDYSPSNTAIPMAEDRINLQTVDCCACGADIPVTAGSTEKCAKISRGNFAIPDRAGRIPDDVTDNIKFDRYVCLKCFLEDEDLCRFFNKLELRVR